MVVIRRARSLSNANIRNLQEHYRLIVEMVDSVSEPDLKRRIEAVREFFNGWWRWEIDPTVFLSHWLGAGSIFNMVEVKKSKIEGSEGRIVCLL